jgi:hypothetical protein
MESNTQGHVQIRKEKHQRVIARLVNGLAGDRPREKRCGWGRASSCLEVFVLRCYAWQTLGGLLEAGSAGEGIVSITD